MGNQPDNNSANVISGLHGDCRKCRVSTTGNSLQRIWPLERKVSTNLPRTAMSGSVKDPTMKPDILSTRTSGERSRLARPDDGRRRSVWRDPNETNLAHLSSRAMPSAPGGIYVDHPAMK